MHRVPSTLAVTFSGTAPASCRDGTLPPPTARASLVANPLCPHHNVRFGPLGVEVFGRTLGPLLRSLDAAAPGASLLLTAPFLVNTRDEECRLVRVVEPAWRVPDPPPHRRWPEAPLGEPMRALEELSLETVRAHGLEAVSASRVGLARGSWATVALADGTLCGAFVAKRRRKRYDNTCYFSAALSGNVAELAYALAEGADPNARDDGTHVLTLACAGGTACVQQLLAAGSQLRERDKPQALHFALSAGKRDVAEWLLQQVADMDTAKWAARALDGARASGDPELLALVFATSGGGGDERCAWRLGSRRTRRLRRSAWRSRSTNG